MFRHLPSGLQIAITTTTSQMLSKFFFGILGCAIRVKWQHLMALSFRSWPHTSYEHIVYSLWPFLETGVLLLCLSCGNITKPTNQEKNVMLWIIWRESNELGVASLTILFVRYAIVIQLPFYIGHLHLIGVCFGEYQKKKHHNDTCLEEIELHSSSFIEYPTLNNEDNWEEQYIQEEINKTHF